MYFHYKYKVTTVALSNLQSRKVLVRFKGYKMYVTGEEHGLTHHTCLMMVALQQTLRE